MQLVAYGAQDIYLTGNPQITFFKVVYRRHTNFSMESIEQTINGAVAGGSRVTSTISRNGDLVYRLFYELTGHVGSSTDTHANVGATAFDNVEIEIGGQRIDRQSGHWMHVWSCLTQENSARVIADPDGTDGTLFQELTGMGGCKQQSAEVDVSGLRIPLQFWFCRNPGLALPLIALQYHEVKVVTTFSAAFGTTHDSTPIAPGASLWADYIYLDTDERRRFAQVSHEYLIEQVQYQAAAGETTSTELNFNHPVKELIWTKPWNKGMMEEESDDRGSAGLEGNYHLKLNGHDRFAPRGTTYFTKQQVWMHHTGCGSLAGNGTASTPGQSANTIAVYSFALKPEEHQPSGTCNFSRIDNAQLYSSLKENRDVFAVNYNVLRIMSGMGGLAYSN